MVACPYNVPKYDYNNRLVRCISASCATRKVWNVSIRRSAWLRRSVPGGRGDFRYGEELMAEAKKRLALKPGSEYTIRVRR